MPETLPKLTKSQKLSLERLHKRLIELDNDGNLAIMIKHQIPEAWHVLEHDLDVQEKKVKVTLWLDQSVAKYYRAMGRGYQARINRILGTYAQMQMADLARFFEVMKKENGGHWAGLPREFR